MHRSGEGCRSKAQGQPDLSDGCVRRDDAYKVFILIRSLLGAKIKCAAGTFATSLYTREVAANRPAKQTYIPSKSFSH